MASAPETVLLQTQDYPAENKPLLDQLLPQLQRQFDAVRTNLAAGLTRSNTAGQDLQVSISTPASDWITCHLKTGFTSSLAVTNGFNAPRYRYAQGALYFDGACEWNNGVGTVPVPTQFIDQLPVLVTGSAGVNSDVSGNWINIAGTYAASALIRYEGQNGQLSIRSAGTAAPASPWQILFLSITCQFPTPGLVVPPLSCFPLTVSTTVTKPTRITVSQITDVTTPVPAHVAVSPGSLYWTPGDPGTFTIQNLAGLALGRQYIVNLYVEP